MSPNNIAPYGSCYVRWGLLVKGREPGPALDLLLHAVADPPLRGNPPSAPRPVLGALMIQAIARMGRKRTSSSLDV